MSLQSRPIPGLFGGISQQIPAMRHPTQCEAQHNMLATVVDGLYLRPGTQATPNPMPLTGANEASVAGSGGDAFAHFFEDPAGDLYVLVLVNGNLMLYDARTGLPETVSFPDGKSYLNAVEPTRGFACLTLADYTFVVNTFSEPAMDSGSTTPLNPTNVAYVDVRTAVASKTYSIQVNGVTGTFTSSSSPDQKAIAEGLRASLTTALGAGWTVTVIPTTNIVKIVKASGAIGPVSAWDTWDTKTMTVVSDGVPTYADLPFRFETGFVVTVNGTADEASDPYYVLWDGTKWVETSKPGVATRLDASTMPHQLVRSGPGWVFQRVPNWGERKVGDEDTAPVPSFVGTSIRDVFFYRNRLGFLAGDGIILSRAGEYFEFFAKTATQVLDNDAIDLASPVGGVNFTTWASPFNQGLVLWTDAAQQFSLVAGEIMSPKTARLVPTTTFTMDSRVRPAALGNRAVFAESAGTFTHLSAYRVAPDAATNYAVQVTEHVPRLVPAAPRQLVASTSAKMVAVLPREVGQPILTFRYELDEAGETYTQRCWATHTLAGRAPLPIAGYWEENKLHLLVHRTDPLDEAPGGRFYVETLDVALDATDPGLDYALCLDRRFVSAPSGTYNASADTTTRTIPLHDSALQAWACSPGQHPVPVQVISVARSGLGGTVVLRGDQRTATLVMGCPYTGTYTFTEALLRDSNGIPMQNATIHLTAYLIRLDKSAGLLADVTPRLRRTFTYQLGVGSVTDAEDPPLGGFLRATEDARVPVRAKARDTKVTLRAPGPLRSVVPYAEWIGQVTMDSRR